jgi:carboxyl-terminal processing protease
VYATGPSAAAGLRHGDRLLRVDGASVAGLSLDSIVARLRGLPDTPVTVEVERSGAPTAFALRRAVVRVPAVQYVLVDRGVAYMPLPSISETAGASVEAALSALAARPDVRGVVLDLRGNPGGAVDQAVRVVSALLPAGRPVLDIRERAGRTTLRTRGTPVAPALPAVVLQDGASASAAEIISGALQDHDRALVVGTRSYGKGLAQTLYPLDNGYALKLTTARWYTPVGRTIHRDRTAGDSARRASDGDRATLDSAAHVSVGGRALPGGGGIAPDLEVQYDTLPSAERDVAVRLRRGGDRAADAIARVALRLSRGADTAFRVTPAWRAALRGELAAAGVAVDSAAWERGAPYVTRLLEQRVADFAFGAAAARRRALAHDRHYLVADSILRAGVRLTPFTPARPA